MYFALSDLQKIHELQKIKLKNTYICITYRILSNE